MTSVFYDARLQFQIYKTALQVTNHALLTDNRLIFSNLTRSKKSTARSPGTNRKASTNAMPAVNRDGISPSVAEKSPRNNKVTSRDLPSSRKSQAIKAVSPPLSNFPLHKFIYTLTLIILLIGAFYSYRMVQHKRQVGGWWNVLMGKTMAHNHGPVNEHDAVGWDKHGENQKWSNPSDSTVEDRINALAQALGMPSPDLARAIAGAVRHHVPPASLSSIAAKETGEAVRILISDDETVDGHPDQKVQKSYESPGGFFGGVVGDEEDFVGMDEP